MRIAVLGVGAIGGVIGAYLTRAGRDVTLIDTWPANIECIRSEGLKVSAVEEEFTVKPTALHLGEVSAARRSFDAIVLSVKSYDTKWAATFAEPYLAPGGFIVSAQNSINEETIAGAVGWTRVVGCVVTLGAGIYEPGCVTRTSDMKRHSFILGEPSGRITERLERIAEVMSAGGPTKTTTNLWGERWAKLATNSMSNALAGITGLKSADLRRHPSTREVSIRVAAELVARGRGARRQRRADPGHSRAPVHRGADGRRGTGGDRGKDGRLRVDPTGGTPVAGAGHHQGPQDRGGASQRLRGRAGQERWCAHAGERCDCRPDQARGVRRGHSVSGQPRAPRRMSLAAVCSDWPTIHLSVGA